MISTQQFPQTRFCDVCRLLDNDVTSKLCSYCGLCDAWICEADRQNTLKVWFTRRLPAAAKRKLEPNYRGASNYEELAVSKEQLEQYKKGETA